MSFDARDQALNEVLAGIVARTEELLARPELEAIKDALEQLHRSAERAASLARALQPDLIAPSSGPEPGDEPSAPGAARGETILVAEDEPDLRDLVGEMLEVLGYKVLMAVNGVEALEVADAHPGKIDALVTDLLMPRMGGVELAQRLQQVRPYLSVLFVSGYPDPAVMEQGVVNSKVHFLQKPFTLEAIAATLRVLLEGDGELRVDPPPA
jgi:CheY-like chemotaxis protein